MVELFKDYPITAQAMLEVANSYKGVPDADPDAMTLAARVAEILETTLDVTPVKKDSLMAVGVLLYMEGNISGDKAIDVVERCTHPIVTDTIYEIWKGEDVSRAEKPNKHILQIFTAVQTARYELNAYQVLRDEIDAEALRRLKGELAGHRLERDTTHYNNIGADKLQLLELDRHRGLLEEINDKLDAQAPAMRQSRRATAAPN